MTASCEAMKSRQSYLKHIPHDVCTSIYHEDSIYVQANCLLKCVCVYLFKLAFTVYSICLYLWMHVHGVHNICDLEVTGCTCQIEMWGCGVIFM